METNDQYFRKGWQQFGEYVREGRTWSGRERNCCYLNLGDLRFASVSYASGLDFLDDGRAVAASDWDLDGDLDLWLSSRISPQLRFMRNELPSQNHFLALRLVGRDCNRDAIGARVEVTLADASDLKLARSLRAGEGFLGQSSKWVHFGLGATSGIEKVMVHWPGGPVETIRGPFEANRRYEVVQGSGKATAWEVPHRTQPQDPHDPDTSDREDPAAVFLAYPNPVSPLTCVDRNGKPIPIAQNAQQPVLLNLWASWCQPCIKELIDFSENRDQIESASLRIVAVSVDSLENGATPDEAAIKLVERLELPFTTGFANEQLLADLQAIVDDLATFKRPLTVPTSFLFDENGELAAIYRSPVSTERILADVVRLETSDEKRLAKSLPFEGRWFSRIVGLRSEAYTRIGAELTEKGEWKESGKYFRRSLASRPNSDAHFSLAISLAKLGQREKSVEHLRHAVRLAPKKAGMRFTLGKSLAEQGKMDEALEQFQQVVSIRPDHANAHNNLALIFFQNGEMELAAQHARDAVRINPDLAGAHFVLGNILRDQGRLKEAMGNFQEATRHNPNFSQAHMELAVLLKITGQIDEALNEFQAAARLRPGWPPAINAVAWILATHPQSEARQPEQAITLAEQIAKASDYREPEILDTLAAAYASAGQFDKAIKYAEMAYEIATKAKDTELAELVKQRLERYRNQTPYHEPAPSPPSSEP